ncbi:MAG: ABC transporter ATP-binding protein [Lachnospiraceae bacterium]|nr:ABC transporter ATP-binding protein [Lachnospiraceae bacterium]
MSLFKCEHLNKTIGDYRLKDISFELEPGTVLGLIGVNGSGKTTLLRSILGSYRLDEDPADSGELWLGGKHFKNDMKAYRSSIAYVLQESPFPRYMTVKEIGETYGHYYKGFDLEKYLKLIKDYEVPEKKWHDWLSKGQKIRVQLAFALSYPASLYIMDEPVGNLDVEFRDVFYDTVRALMANENCSVILSSHLVTELEHIVDDLLWLSKKDNTGYTRYSGSIDDLKNNYRLLSVAGESAAGIPKELIIGAKLNTSHNEYMLYSENGNFDLVPAGLQDTLRYPELQEIMYYTEKGNKE